ncbi:hypothetical protein JXQ70_11180 [bacterium]|nr:hypothetical protein [bacterium]
MIRSWTRPILACCLAFAHVCGLPAYSLGQSSPTVDLVIQDYERLLSNSYCQTPFQLPEAGICWERDTAKWTLKTGTIYLGEPLSDGTVATLIFEGEGEFQLTIPDPIEIDQLRRFSGDEALTVLHEHFDKLIIATSEPLPFALPQLAGAPRYTVNKDARKNMDRWLRDVYFDSFVRLISARLSPHDQYFVADMDTKHYGWLRYEFDAQRQEEIHLMKLQKTNTFLEIWISLDQQKDRLPSGRPSPIRHEFWDIIQTDLSLDVLEKSDKERQGWSRTKPRAAEFKAIVTLKNMVPDQAGLLLYLHPLAKVTSVTDQTGHPLSFIRNPIGEHYTSIKKEIHESSLLIILPTPLPLNQTMSVTIEYNRDILNYASGRFWYPTIKYCIEDEHMAKISIKMPADFEFRSVGKRVEERLDVDGKFCVWQTEKPVRAVGFTFGKNYQEHRVPLQDGSMEVISFGRDLRLGSGQIMKKVGQDIADSLAFFQKRFDLKLPFQTLYASSIASPYGQAFDGFLHLSEYTYMSEHPGASELFRAHEAAHQFWGLMVSFDSYRDQWLSEALAEYSAMLFIQDTMPDKKYFEEIIAVYQAELTSSLKGALSKFARPWNIKFHPAERKRIGPVAVGFRASPAEIPQAYFIQSYHKGAYIIHMIRMILQQETGNDTLFFTILADFLKTFKGKSATTDDFCSTIESNTNHDWHWFFDQWVNQNFIPVYAWHYSVSDNKNPDMFFMINLEVEQTMVPDNFTMPVPVRIISRTGDIKDFVIQVDQPKKSFQLLVPDQPKTIILNPDNIVLAKMTK